MRPRHRLAALPGVGLVLLLVGCAGGGDVRPGGLVTGEGRGHVYVCDDLTLSAWIGPEEAWLFLPGETVRLPHVRAASGARYENERILFWTRADEAILEVDGVTHAGCRRDPRTSILEDAKLRGVAFRGVGQEPGWVLEIGPGDVPAYLEVELDHGATTRTFGEVRVAATSTGGRTVYEAVDATGPIRVVLEGGPCHDVMSGEAFPTAVRLELGERILKGCGRPLH